ncbi:DinB family protein [Amycolatopsis sp. OK19-0408]|uniref:DinB family protein n=1 Tax=Amycolatopsis iheyensis TaxID=2945988 RepID=A0A9X2N7D5_9PSEU|nr:DinB family protein [Amycolatopsis iheyensis]MCR6483676.1 DinB family protein [Amycolatopsis iheyensis]
MQLTEDDYLWFADRALDGMATILTDLGDDRANRRPPLPGANTPFAIVTHCLGVLEFWVGALVAGRVVERDRAAEFTASGPVAGLVERVVAAKARLRADLAVADPAAPPRGEVPEKYRGTPAARTQGGVLQHVYEELAQHHGQLELTRDVLM